MGDDSIVGIVDLMTGEKDPRNLMLVFSILKVVMIEWDISNHAEVCVPYRWGPRLMANENRPYSMRCITTSRLRLDLPRTTLTVSLRRT